MMRDRLFILAFILLLFTTTLSAQQPQPVGTPDGSIGEIEIDVGGTAQGVVGLSEEIARSTAGTFTDILEQVLVTPRSEVARILLVLGGVLLLIAGWRVYEFIIIIAGILIGATVGGSLFANSDPFLQFAAFVIGGLFGAILAAFLYYVAVFFIGAYIGIIVAAAVAGALGYDQLSPLIILIAAVIGGIILLGLSFQLLIFLAAIVGAQMITLGLGLDPLWTFVLAIVGIILQITLARASGYDIRRPPGRRSWRFRRT